MATKKSFRLFDTVEVALSKRREDGRGGLVQVMFSGMYTIQFDFNFIRKNGSI